MSDKPRCSGAVKHGAWLREESCYFGGKVERDGKWYCSMHDPQRRIDREAMRNAEKEMSTSVAIRAHIVIAEAVKSYKSGLLMGDGPLARAVEAYLAAKGEAE